MGDTNNLNLWIPVVPAGYLDALVSAFEEYSGGYHHYEDDRDGGALRLGANDCSQGSCYELPGSLDLIIKSGVEEVECSTCKGEGEIKAASLAEDDKDCPDCEATGYISLEPVDFGYVVNDEPKYEWMGTITIHVPGFAPDFQGSCDADGRPMLDNTELMPLIDKATDLEDLRSKIKLASGETHFDALRAWAAAQRQ